MQAILFLDWHVVEIDLPWLDHVVRAKRTEHVPVVLTPEEIRRVLPNLDGSKLATTFEQELLGHADVKTTMICTHVVNRGGKGVQSPLDR